MRPSTLEEEDGGVEGGEDADDDDNNDEKEEDVGGELHPPRWFDLLLSKSSSKRL